MTDMFSDLESQKIPGTVCYIQKAANRPPLLFLHLKFTANYPLSSAAMCRKFVMSRNGGAPNKRLYSRLNWEGLS
jgi:hypothetical protein